VTNDEHPPAAPSELQVLEEPFDPLDRLGPTLTAGIRDFDMSATLGVVPGDRSLRLGSVVALSETPVEQYRDIGTGERDLGCLDRSTKIRGEDGIYAVVAPTIAECPRLLTTHDRLAPLVDEEHRRLVHEQVTDAVERGARCMTGGTIPDGPGAFYPATVLTDVPPDARVLHEETFGPVVPVVVVDDFADALRQAATSEYGLAATVLTDSQANALEACLTSRSAP
jgi:Aldehyde dehydrogenase family